MPPKAASKPTTGKPAAGQQGQGQMKQGSTSQLPGLQGSGNRSMSASKLPDQSMSQIDQNDEGPTTDNIRQYILKHYGINAQEEKMKKEKRAERFRQYVQNTGLQTAFQLVISEFLSKSITKEEAFKFAAKRMKEIGKEYEEIKKNIDDKKAKEVLKLNKEKSQAADKAATSTKTGKDAKLDKSKSKSPQPTNRSKSAAKKK